MQVLERGSLSIIPQYPRKGTKILKPGELLNLNEHIGKEKRRFQYHFSISILSFLPMVAPQSRTDLLGAITLKKTTREVSLILREQMIILWLS